MLTDIFARRYQDVPMWKTFTEEPRRLIVQGFQLLNQLHPYVEKSIDVNQATWNNLHAFLAREFGVKELSPFTWGYWGDWMGNRHYYSGTYNVNKVCENWMLQTFDATVPADVFIKERLSMVELGFRFKESAINYANSHLPKSIAEAEIFMKTRAERKGGMFVPGSRVEGVKAENATINFQWKSALDELNARFRQAGCKLHYHNGFVQIASDELVTQKVEAPFWDLVADPKWKNVDHDMKEALDLRDTDGRDPALYAAKALESAIKIISDERKLSTGKEHGAANYIDNLRREKLIDVWEVDILKSFFSKVRNPMGHGPGSGELVALNKQQTDWAIEQCITWVKSLILRL